MQDADYERKIKYDCPITNTTITLEQPVQTYEAFHNQKLQNKELSLAKANA